MLIKHDLLQRLKDFGLNSYEAKLWVSLLSRGTATAGELADMANVPRSRSYDVLDSLEKKGFITHKSGKPLYYVSITPESVISTLKIKIKEETMEHIGLLTNISNASLFKELEQLHNQGSVLIEPSEQLGCIKGKTALIHHISTMVSKAQKSILLYGHSNDLNILNTVLNEHKQMLSNKKIDVKSFIHGKTSNTNNINSKQAKYGNGRFIIIDKKEMLVLPLDTEKVHSDYDCGIWSMTPIFSAMLQDILDKQ